MSRKNDFQEYNSAELNNNLPSSWLLLTLGEITQPTRPHIKPSERPELTFIGMEHIEAHTMKLLNTVQASSMKSSAIYFQMGDVLYGRLRPYLNKVYSPDFEGLCSAEFIVFPRSAHVDSRYFKYFLNSWNFVSYASHLNEGDRPRVDFEQLAFYPFPLAPLDEQKRIVAEIEKQFSRLDEAIANLKRAQANLKRYKAAVLKAAIEGKLTKQWREEHPKVGYQEPQTPTLTDLKLPSGWTIATIQQLSSRVQYGTSSKTTEEAVGVPVLRMGNICEGQIVLDKLKYLPEQHEEFPELFLEPGDLLFNRTNSPELVGKTAVYGGKPAPCSFASYLIRVQFNSGVQPKFISYYINSICGRQWIKSVVSQQVGQANVNGTKLQALTVPLPPAQEQQEIVLQVENRFSIIGEIEKAIETNLVRAERLRQSILKKAFCGQLVPQDPNDEPASILLERIRAERERNAKASIQAKPAKSTSKKHPATVPTEQLPLNLKDIPN